MPQRDKLGNDWDDKSSYMYKTEIKQKIKYEKSDSMRTMQASVRYTVSI